MCRSVKLHSVPRSSYFQSLYAFNPLKTKKKVLFYRLLPISGKKKNIPWFQASAAMLMSTRCPETSVNNYHTTPCNYPEDAQITKQALLFGRFPGLRLGRSTICVSGSRETRSVQFNSRWRHRTRTGHTWTRTGHTWTRTGHTWTRTGHTWTRTGYTWTRTGHTWTRTGHTWTRTGHTWTRTGHTWTRTGHTCLCTPWPVYSSQLLQRGSSWGATYL
jgi:hypothetical protein